MTAAMVLVPATGVLLISVVVIAWQVGRQGTSVPVQIRLLPSALLLVTLPAVVGAFQIIKGFQQIAEAGSAGRDSVLAFLVPACESLLWTSFAWFVVVAAASVWQWLIAQSLTPEAGMTVPGAATPIIVRWLALLSPLAILPAAYIVHLIDVVTVLVTEAAGALTAPNPPADIAGMRVGELSAYISSRLLIVEVGGALLSAWLAAMALLNLLPMRGAISRRVTAYGWIAAAIALGMATWLVLRFWSVLRWSGSIS